MLLHDKMSNNGVYANDRPPSGETEYSGDPAAGGFFSTEFRKHEDLKNMLDSNKDGLNLEAMKRIIGMVAKGKDASDLFPAVVKNVVSKNIEVKKLVYVYLVRYAEEQQDLALLSISTFQRALKDPNQLIRASALRVLSSIRVPVIVPIMMLAIKDAVNDMSPYVRKTAAHAIPKLYSLEPEQKDQLIEVIEKLLLDKTTLVMGSAVMAFEEVCPERIDLIHKNYRKLCNLLVDVEEWGQVIIINMLTRYARTQFIDPNKNCGTDEGDEKAFYESDNSESKGDSESKKTYTMDPDHRLLLRNCKPLLQSRNAAVVMAVAQLYYYLSPRSEVNIIAKALIRLIHSHREIQSVVLSNIATLSTKHKGMFEPYLKSFFVRFSDPTHIKLLKLEILTNLATENSVSFILREFQTYVSSPDMEFVAATIQAIGRCASNISEVTDTCLNGLVSLLSNRNETVVAESVVVIKKLLQMQPNEHKEIIVHMSRLMDSITVPMARASILWLLGEYADRVTKIAPDVLRKVAKNFANEEDIVKLQALNLAAKLYLTNSKQTKLLTQYVFNLAKYDQNYDIRDRSRFLRQFIMPQGEKGNLFGKHAKKILLASKPAPVLQSKFKDRDQFQLGSLSHYLNCRATGFRDLPPFPEEAPDPAVRNVDVPTPWQEFRFVKKKKQMVKKKSFYSETESSSPDKESEESASSASEAAESGESKEESSGEEESETESSSDDSESEESESSESKSDSKVKAKSIGKWKKDTKESSSGSEETSESESERDESSDSDNAEEKRKPATKKKKSEEKPTSMDLLLDLEDFGTPAVTPIIQPSPANVLLTPSSNINEKLSNLTITATAVPAVFIPNKLHELLNRYNGNGLVASYRFTRSPNLYSPKMTTVEITLNNTTQEGVLGIHVPDKKSGSVEIKGFPEIATLAPNATIQVTVGIDYSESTQPVKFELRTSKNMYSVTIKAPVGEIIQPVAISEGEFISEQNKLKGMNENTGTIDLSAGHSDGKALVQYVYEAANVMQVPNNNQESNVLSFTHKEFKMLESSGKLLLISSWNMKWLVYPHYFEPSTSVTMMQYTPYTKVIVDYMHSVDDKLETAAILFAGQTLSSKCLVLIAVQVLSNGKASITVNCEKIIIGSMLIKELKEALAK